MTSRPPHPRSIPATAAGLVAAAVGLVVLGSSAHAGISGMAASGIQLHNVGAGATDLEFRLRHEAGDPPVTIRRDGIGPQRAYNLYLPAEAALRTGAYAGTVVGSADLVPLSRLDWSASSASAMSGGARAATVVSVPLVRNDGSSFETLVSIQNTDEAAPASITVRAIRSGSAAEVAAVPLTLGAGGSATLDLGRSAAFAALQPFDGALVLDADRPIAASVLIDGVDGPGVAGYAAPTAGEASPVLLLPYVPIDALDAAGRRWRADLGLHNPGVGDASATLTVEGVGACDGDDHTAPLTLPAGGAARVDLGPDATGIAAGCTAVARITVDGGASLTGALLARGRSAAGASAALVGYTALPLAAARDDLAAPIWRANHTSWRFTTRLHLFNPGAAPVDATLEVWTSSGTAVACPEACALTVPPGGLVVDGGLGGAMAAGSYGSARIRAAGALVGVVVDAAERADDAAFTLLSTADVGRRWLPLLLRDGSAAGRPTEIPPTPVASTTPVPVGTPVAWPAPVPGDGRMGVAVAGLSLFNHEAQPHTARVEFWPASGEPRIVERPGVEPAGLLHIYVPASTELVNGSYLAYVENDAFESPVLRLDWMVTGGALSLSSSAADDHIVLPLRLRPTERAILRVGMPANTGFTTGTVDFGAGAEPITVASQRFVTLAVPRGARVAEVRMDRPVVASALVFDDGVGRAVYDVTGFGAGDASTERWIVRAHRAAPLVDALGVTRSTRIVVANPSAADVLVTATLYGEAGACAGQAIAVGPRTVARGDAIAIDLADETAVPEGCSGPLQLNGSGPFVANGVESSYASGQRAAAAAAPAVAPGAARDDLWLPVVMLAHTPMGLTTDVSVVNPGPMPRTVTLSAKRSDGVDVPVPGASVVLPPLGGHVFRGADALGHLVRSYGSGRITSDGPVVVRVDTFAATGRLDTTALLARASAGQAVRVPGEQHVLWAERNSDIAQAVPTAPAAPTPTAVPPSAPTPTAVPPSAPTPTAAPTSGPPLEPPVVVLAVGLVNVAGGAAPGCAACDGVYGDDDRAAAARSPLPRLRFVAEDPTGRRLAVAHSSAVDGLQVAALPIAAADAAGTVVVRVDSGPGGWTGCPNAPLRRELTFKDFTLGTARLDFHFSNHCTPAGGPPLVPVALPDLPTRLGWHDLFFPFASAGPSRGAQSALRSPGAVGQ